MNTCEVRYFQDGKLWCATFNDFINLQESPAGFGKTKEQALADLRFNLVWERKAKDAVESYQQKRGE